MSALLRTLAPETPTSGIYRGVPAERYHAWPYVSNSRLTTLKRSPFHLRYELANPSAPTAAMLLGTATHSAVLEPEAFAGAYTVAEQCSATTKAGGQCSKGGSVRKGGAWFCSQHAPAGEPDALTVISADDYAACLAQRDAVRSHPMAGRLLQLAGDVEVSLVWEAAGVTCKARLDRLCGDAGVVVDLKTTKDASPREVTRTIFARGYHRQAAMYLDALAALGAPAADFVIIAVEKEAPYGVGVYRLTDDAVDAGRREIAALLARYRTCLERDEWPGYTESILDISLPAWAWDQLETLED